jgi:Zn-dependent peptidase ImmA (M78 family)
MPPRRLNFRDTVAVAEAQARLIRKRLGEQPVTAETLALLLPRLRVVTMSGMPFSGSAHWTGRDWLIALNGSEPSVRRHFSLGHELKHIIDHPLYDVLYPANLRSAARLREWIADYFSGCLLMPKRTLTTLFCNGWSIPELSEVFDVSARALEVRLSQLGLREDVPSGDCQRSPMTRFSASVPLGVAA